VEHRTRGYDSGAVTDDALARAAAPVHDVPAPRTGPAEGTGLCLSGGGYRAMLFHAGALWRLNELAFLPRLARVSSVSGGSLAAGVLASRWARLSFDAGVATNFIDEVVAGIRALASRTLDVRAIVLGVLLPGSPANRLAAALKRHVFGDATLQDLPDAPRFVFNATSLQSGALWRMSKPYAWDYRVGELVRPEIPLADAVAASSAGPPYLSPFVLRLGPLRAGSGDDLQFEPYTSRAVLTDGGVYDNLGLEPVWKNCATVLVSDAGGKLGPDPDPPHFWLTQMLRVLSVIDNQVRSLRKRQLIASLRLGVRDGAYWGIRSRVHDYGLPDALEFPHELPHVRTRLARLDEATQELLINWGYVICDTAMRRHVVPNAARPQRLPY
jgi:NTE family protein